MFFAVVYDRSLFVSFMSLRCCRLVSDQR